LEAFALDGGEPTDARGGDEVRVVFGASAGAVVAATEWASEFVWLPQR
jgi:hypothetical protein